MSYHIGVGLKGNVYAGTTRKLKDGSLIWTNKKDCTSEFYDTLLNLFFYAGEENRLSFGDDKNVYVLTLEKRNKEK